MKPEKNLVFVPAADGRPAHYLTEITLRYRRIRRFAGYTKESARIYVGELRKAAREGGLDEFLDPKKAGDTFGEYGRTLLDSAEWRAKRSHKRDEISLEHLKRAMKNVRLEEINPALVRKYMTKRREEDGMSAATVNRELSFLKSVLYSAEYDGVIQSNPIRGRRVRKFEEANHREKIILGLGLTDDDQRRFIESAADYLQPILKLALTTGMRQGEILKMKWKDLNLVLKTIRVPAENAKSKKERIVPVTPELCVELDSLPHLGDYIFFNPETRKNMVDIRRPFKAALKAAEIKGLRFHDLRHLAASRLVKVTDIVTASKILGHSSLDMTLRYVHPTEKDKHAAVEKAAENLFRGRQKDVNASEGQVREEATVRSLVN